MIEINSWFSTNEFIEIPIDFYADDNLTKEKKIPETKTNEEDELPSLEDIIKDSNINQNNEIKENKEIKENEENNENKKEKINNEIYNIKYKDNIKY